MTRSWDNTTPARTLIKICGIRDATMLQVAVDAGADAIGFVLAPGSPRSVSLDEAIRLAESLPDQPYFSTRCQATNAVLLDGILRLKQGTERRSVLQMDTQDGESTFFGVEVCRRVEFVPLL